MAELLLHLAEPAAGRAALRRAESGRPRGPSAQVIINIDLLAADDP